MTLAPIIGLFGISGVGKTWMGTQLVIRYPSILHLQASSLLRDTLRASGERLRTATSTEISSNQQALANSLSQARVGHEERPVVLDAHSVIDNDRQLVPISIEAIKPLNLHSIVFIHDDPSVIAARRLASDRFRPSRTLEELECQQNLAKEVCQSFSSTLSIPIKICRAGDVEAMFASVLDALKL
jgi:adenylate kinase